MTVEADGHTIVLSGRCGAEEAEALLGALIEDGTRKVELRAEKIHTAIWQVLLALKPALSGSPPTEFERRHILPLALKDQQGSGNVEDPVERYTISDGGHDDGNGSGG